MNVNTPSINTISSKEKEKKLKIIKEENKYDDNKISRYNLK